MSTSQKKILSAAAVGAAAVAAARTVADRTSNAADEDVTRWRVVTVNRPLDDVVAGTPAPLADLGDAVEVRVHAAPGDKGSELWARWRDGADLPDDQDPAQVLRRALRGSKQLLEVGWVLEPGRHTTTEDTVLNAPLRKAISTARGAGLL
ncbi:hypothetical protein [Cellulomonas xylanilytica]|uniref:Secreted protein n=1 Tax=Cellulomonas xylanilytica TaxID=233583 RepID=A0A510V995_9CELL|nr:hypothetical protein [Cellulomonas xylanilytica]GEK23442.1 hypothetical protein CXY01_39620 [Cellulomonas xylanilytica]